MIFAIEDPTNIGIVLATMVTISYLYYYYFCLRSRDQTQIERQRYGKNRKSVEEAVDEQRHKAGLIADYKKELDRVLAQVNNIFLLFDSYHLKTFSLSFIIKYDFIEKNYAFIYLLCLKVH